MNGMAFALILTALALALLVWCVLDLNARLRTLETSKEQRSPAHVAAAIEDLRTALAQVQATNRREFGSIWKRLGLSRATAAAESELPAASTPAANDDSFAAMLALQSTPPIEPK